MTKDEQIKTLGNAQRVLLNKLDDCDETITELKNLLAEAIFHLDYCGYGDSWERECARDSGMIKRMDNALEKYDLKSILITNDES